MAKSSPASSASFPPATNRSWLLMSAQPILGREIASCANLRARVLSGLGVTWRPSTRYMCTQEAWNEKVLVLSFQDFWLMFPYFRTLKDKMTLISKSSNDSFLRYGNPHMPFLWTLSWKFEFQVNLTIFMLNVMLWNVSMSILWVEMIFIT